MGTTLVFNPQHESGFHFHFLGEKEERKNLSTSKHTLENTTEFILEKGLMNVLNVGNPLGTIQHLFDIRSFMLENKTWT